MQDFRRYMCSCPCTSRLLEPLVACIAAHSRSSPADSFFAYVAWKFGWSRIGSDVASIADKYRRQVTDTQVLGNVQFNWPKLFQAFFFKFT